MLQFIFCQNPNVCDSFIRMSVTSAQVLLEFFNENLINNTKITTTGDNKSTVVVGSDKSAVRSVSRASTCALRKLFFALTHNTVYSRRCIAVRMRWR